MLPAGNGASTYSDQCASSTPRCVGENDGTGTACTLNAAGNGCAASGACTGSDDGSGTACATNDEGTGCAVEGGDCVFTRSCFYYDQPTCMPMVPSGWGSSTDCNDEMHNHLGWWNFIILVRYTNAVCAHTAWLAKWILNLAQEPVTPAWKPVNYNGDASSWDNTFRPVCATDDVIDGRSSHPTGKVMEVETCDDDLRISGGGTSGMPGGGCVPTGTTIWHSVDTSWPTNQAGNNFAIYILPEAEITSAPRTTTWKCARSTGCCPWGTDTVATPTRAATNIDAYPHGAAVSGAAATSTTNWRTTLDGGTLSS
jgi:hypothetical protein